MPVKSTSFLLITAVVELAAGLALLIAPGALVGWILGALPSAPEALLLARWIGVALIVIGVASGLARDDPGGLARRGVLCAVVLYDVAAALLLISAAVGPRLAGPLLWPAVALHAALAVWGLRCRTERARLHVQREGG
jgi:hypothetical protein